MPVLGPHIDPHRAPGCIAINGQRQVDAADTEPAVAERSRPQHVAFAQEVGDERRLRPLVDIAGSADLLDHAVVHHDDTVGHRQRFLLVVRDHDRRHSQPPLQLPDLATQTLAHLGIEG